MASITRLSALAAFSWPLLWLAGGQTSDVTVNCPASLQDGKTSLVTATVNTSKFLQCDLNPVTRPAFIITLPQGSLQMICAENYPVCNTTFNAAGCRCKDVVDDIYTYELNFVFDKATQTGGTLDLRLIACLSSSVYPFTHSSCEYLTEWYGPETVTLIGFDVFDLHPTQPGAMTLTCVASAYNPSVTYSWSRLCDGGTSGSTCTFIPTVSDHNSNITCTVTNTVAQVTRTASRTITLNYPPDTAPSVNYNDDILYAGDYLTLVCTVRGGNPLVTRIIFSCDGQQDGCDVMGQDGVSRSVTFTPLVAGDDGINCTCRAEWKHSTWYTLTATRRLTVNATQTTDRPTTEVPRTDAQNKNDSDGSLSLGAGIGIAIAVGIACTVGVEAAICVLWRRKAKQTSNAATGSAKPPVVTMSSRETVIEEAKGAADYTESAAAGPYESLRLEDVGQRSVYEGLQKTTGVR